MSSKVHKIRDVFANNFCVELIFLWLEASKEDSLQAFAGVDGWSHSES